MSEKTSRQLVLNLPLRTALGREDFLVTPSNAAAVAMIDRYPEWPAYAMVLKGAGGSGKSHLLEVWRRTANAKIVSAGELGAATPDELLATSTNTVERRDKSQQLWLTECFFEFANKGEFE